jgi:hypothetical protein
MMGTSPTLPRGDFRGEKSFFDGESSFFCLFLGDSFGDGGGLVTGVAGLFFTFPPAPEVEGIGCLLLPSSKFNCFFALSPGRKQTHLISSTVNVL